MRSPLAFLQVSFPSHHVSFSTSRKSIISVRCLHLPFSLKSHALVAYYTNLYRYSRIYSYHESHIYSCSALIACAAVALDMDSSSYIFYEQQHELVKHIPLLIPRHLVAE